MNSPLLFSYTVYRISQKDLRRKSNHPFHAGLLFFYQIPVLQELSPLCTRQHPTVATIAALNPPNPSPNAAKTPRAAGVRGCGGCGSQPENKKI
jgi:hypothetical protein